MPVEKAIDLVKRYGELRSQAVSLSGAGLSSRVQLKEADDLLAVIEAAIDQSVQQHAQTERSYRSLRECLPLQLRQRLHRCQAKLGNLIRLEDEGKLCDAFRLSGEPCRNLACSEYGGRA